MQVQVLHDGDVLCSTNFHLSTTDAQTDVPTPFFDSLTRRMTHMTPPFFLYVYPYEKYLDTHNQYHRDIFHSSYSSSLSIQSVPIQACRLPRLTLEPIADLP